MTSRCHQCPAVGKRCATAYIHWYVPSFVPSRPPLDSLEACEEDFSRLLSSVRDYASEADLDPLERAWCLSRDGHAGRTRASGQPHVAHSLEIGWILAGLEQDVPTVCAGLLHDCVEETDVTLDHIVEGFGSDVADLVAGVTRLEAIETESKKLELAENIRKLMVATARDVRVLLLKLADRLDDMRFLGWLDEERRDRLAEETRLIYAPLANRLGIQPIKSELEDLTFRHTHPEAYDQLRRSLSRSRQAREEYIAEVVGILSSTLAERGIDATVYGRPKHLYSIYQKMQRQNVPFEGVFDVTAFRILVDSEPRCWEVLGIVHGKWIPVPNRFRDYLSLPKSNGYRSLHTTVMGPKRERMEVQIRTHEMHRIAEEGVAAHWRYKEGGIRPDARDVGVFSWLRSILEYGQEVEDSAEFMESAVGELFGGEIYVFTPAGDVYSFRRGATPVDFAYSVHSKVGDHCHGAKVNGAMVPLNHKLRSGDKVEILTSPNQHPKASWLEFVVSPRAKAKIRSYVRKEERERAIELGREWFEKALRERGRSLAKMEKKGQISAVLEQFKVARADELYHRIGIGKLAVGDVVDRLFPPEKVDAPETNPGETPVARPSVPTGGIAIGEMDDILIRLSKCCNPVPGDPIVGFITRGRGVTVHRRDCPRAMSLDPERKIEASWKVEMGDRRPVQLRVICQDRPGILARLTNPFETEGANIDSVRSFPHEHGTSAVLFGFRVSHLSELEGLIRRLEKVNGVYSVERV